MTQSAAVPPLSSLEKLIARVVDAERDEILALLASFAFFFCVLTAYYIIRPIRDEMGLMLGQDELHWLFVYVFAVMLAAVPVFGAVVRGFPGRKVVPVVYAFFILNLIGFWLVLEAGGQTKAMARIFFVWVSIFNLFIVSLFWSLMSELWASPQAKRLYGFIAAGGSAGALTGPFITQSLVKVVGTDSLLLVSATFLGLALLLTQRLRAEMPVAAVPADSKADHGILAGALQVWNSPYLFRIALWVLLANLILTYFYLEQARIVGAAIPNRADRVQLLARVDLTVGILTILFQLFLTGRVMSRFGIGIAAGSLPALAILGFCVLAISPTVPVILAIMIAERAIGFGFANPAARVLWTVVEPEEKYKAQNFIDTVVYRGGDAASGWLFSGLAKGLGLSGGAIAFVTLPFAVVWLVLAFSLARMQAERAEAAAPSNERKSA